jgi:hypothetical protein
MYCGKKLIRVFGNNWLSTDPNKFDQLTVYLWRGLIYIQFIYAVNLSSMLFRLTFTHAAGNRRKYTVKLMLQIKFLFFGNCDHWPIFYVFTTHLFIFVHQYRIHFQLKRIFDLNGEEINHRVSSSWINCKFHQSGLLFQTVLNNPAVLENRHNPLANPLRLRIRAEKPSKIRDIGALI